ncbi:hypothetical protein NDU88_007468 [Pleurodeles waltl]|uniref:Uncharacterized protein n=1 Tax=Pleurodeles waltl TaxID=8319 RepID=A0AAV7WHR9_PLEWA|nr:hypothetical protein NDU88_007468 [Pleurodeles waltl]
MQGAGRDGGARTLKDGADPRGLKSGSPMSEGVIALATVCRLIAPGAGSEKRDMAETKRRGSTDLGL